MPSDNKAGGHRKRLREKFIKDIWITLQYLFDIPMSRTDVVFLCSFDFEDFAKELGMKMRFITIEQDLCCRQSPIQGFKKSLTNE